METSPARAFDAGADGGVLSDSRGCVTLGAASPD